jgi:hypothetical protein
MSIAAGRLPISHPPTTARRQQLDDELRTTRARIAEVQDGLGELHRSRSSDVNGLAARQQALLVEMAKLQQRLNDLDNERRGFGPQRRP